MLSKFSIRVIVILFFLNTFTSGFAQIWSTGTVTLDSDYTVRFDITSSTVTMTLVGPSNRWLGVALTNTSYVSENSMGQFSGDDVVIYFNNVLSDRFMPDGNSEPNIDTNQNWNIISNTVDGLSVRTVIANRARLTGDSNDFVFPASLANFVIVWAKGAVNSQNLIAYHTGGRGATMASTTLATQTFEEALSLINVYPNPVSKEIWVDIPNRKEEEIYIEIYNILGKRILVKQANGLKNNLNISNWRNGVYIMKISSNTTNKTVTKQIIKI